MQRLIFLVSGVLFFAGPAAFGQEPEAGEQAQAAETVESQVADGETSEPSEPIEPSGPKTMSGMSILGNEEAPKSLVIIPWKSSELGEDISLSDTLDDRARPVDKDVFLRELNFYAIRSGE